MTTSLPNSNPADNPADRIFTDSENREWPLRLDFDTADEIRRLFKLDFGDVPNFTKIWAEVLWDDQLALRILWFLVAQSAGELSEKDWRKSMDGERLETAREALLQTVFFFTPPAKRQMLSKATDGVTSFYKQAIGEAEQDIEQTVSETMTRYKKQLGSSRQRSQASSGTSTGNGRSAKRSRR